METKPKLKYKQVVVVRNDLGMSVGKIAAQASHVAVLASEKARVQASDDWNSWLNEGYRKIVCQASSASEILDLVKICDQKMVIFSTTYDIGFTEVPSGTLTAIAIGPGKNEQIDSITGRLKLLR